MVTDTNDLRSFTKGLAAENAKVGIVAIQRAVTELEVAENRIVELEKALSEKSEIDRQIREVIWLGEPGSILQAVKALWGNLQKAQARVKELEAERDGLQARNGIQAGQLKHIDGEISPLMSEVSALKVELTASKARVADLEKWNQETLDENNRLDRELDEARQALKAMQSRPVLTWEEFNHKWRETQDLSPQNSRLCRWVQSRLPVFGAQCRACNTPRPLENIGIDWKPASVTESEVVNG